MPAAPSEACAYAGKQICWVAGIPPQGAIPRGEVGPAKPKVACKMQREKPKDHSKAELERSFKVAVAWKKKYETKKKRKASEEIAKVSAKGKDP